MILFSSVLADRVASGILNKVEANPEHYFETDFDDPGEIDGLIHAEVQDDYIDEPDYMEFVQFLIEHPAIEAALKQCKIEVKDAIQDAEEWAKGPASYYGIRQSDFL